MKTLFNECCDELEVDPICPCEEFVPTALTTEYLILDKQDGDSTVNYSGTVNFKCCDGSTTLTLTEIDFGELSDILSSPDIGSSTTDGTFDFDILFSSNSVPPGSFTVQSVLAKFEACGESFTKKINVTVKDTCLNSYPGLLSNEVINLDIIDNDGETDTINIPYEFTCCSGDNDFTIVSYNTIDSSSGLTLLLPEVGEVITTEQLTIQYNFDGLSATVGTYDLDVILKFCDTVTRKQKIRFIVGNTCESMIPPILGLDFPDVTFHDTDIDTTEDLNFVFSWDCCTGGAEYLGYTSLDNETQVTYNGLPPDVGVTLDDSILSTLTGSDGTFNQIVTLNFNFSTSIGKDYTIIFNFRFCGTNVYRSVRVKEEVPIAPGKTIFANNLSIGTVVFVSAFTGLDSIPGPAVLLYDTTIAADLIALTDSVEVPSYRSLSVPPEASSPDPNYLYSLSDVQSDTGIIQSNLLSNSVLDLDKAVNCGSFTNINNASVPDIDGKPKTMSSPYSILNTTTGTPASAGILVKSSSLDPIIRAWGHATSNGSSVLAILDNDPSTGKLLDGVDWSIADIYNPDIVAHKYPGGTNRFYLAWHIIDIDEAADGYLRFEVELGTLLNSSLKWRVTASSVSQIKGGFSTTGTNSSGGSLGINNSFVQNRYLPNNNSSPTTSNNSCYWDGSKYQFIKSVPFVSPAAIPTLFDGGSPYGVTGKFPMQVRVNNVDQVVIQLMADNVGSTNMTAGVAGTKADFSYHIDNFEYFT